MRIPPDGVTVGSTFSKADIEETFETGFGYQISGINPRRDASDRRYILLFANEDGPYGDAVTDGRFEYIGEGLSGDQSETSPGNSALIDAIDGGIPVHFFYKPAAGDGWEYQGRVDVIDVDREERDGREVLVFTMEHRSGTQRPRDSGLYLIPVNDEWRERFGNSVEHPHDLTQYGTLPAQLEGHDQLRIWGTTETDSVKKQDAIDRLRPGDCMLFYHDGEFIAGGVVGRVFESPNVGELLWNRRESRYIFTVDGYTESVPSVDRVWEWLGYSGRQVVSGFSRVSDDRLGGLRKKAGSVQGALFERAPTPEQIADEETKLHEKLDEDPQLTESREEYAETRRKVRDAAFARAVKAAYDDCCAICGSRRESPAGNPEVEAAHIYPKHENGADDIRNGIALCKLHHWAFDVGWLALSDTHELLVSDAQQRTGYEEFKRVAGQRIRLPSEERTHPHPMFMRKHRHLNGFDNA